MNIGLTGGIATGKSTVSAMLRSRGAVIIDADQVAREVVEPDTEGAKRLFDHFGPSIFQEDGTLDRAALGQIIFRDPEARQKVNQLLHPLIRSSMKQQAKEAAEQDPKRIIIWDIPLLFESGLTDFVEKVIVVYVPVDIQIKRLMKRNQLSDVEANDRIVSQMSIEEKKKLADFLIDNSGSLERTERQVDDIWNYLTSKNG